MHRSSLRQAFCLALLALVSTSCRSADSTQPGDIDVSLAKASAPAALTPVATITINSGPLSVTVGGTLQLTATLKDSRGKVLTGRTVTWQSGTPAVAAISAQGMVTGVTNGSSLVTATSEGKSDTARVYVYTAYVSPGNFATTITAIFTVRDSVRNRDIPVRVRYPVGAVQPMPVILSIPGGGAAVADPGTGGGASGWGTILAKSGAAVIHTSSPAVTQAAYCAEFAVPSGECAAATPSWRIMRAIDASTIVSRLAQIGATIGVTLDATRVGVTGHSSGAGAVMMLAGAPVNISPSVQAVSLADPHFTAFLANSPPGATSNVGFTSAAFANVVGPLLMQSGSNDFVNEQTPAIRRAIYDVMPAGNKYMAFFTSTDATHAAFDVEFAPGLLQSYISRVGVAFFDGHLQNIEAARTWLTTNQLAGWSGNVGTISSK